MPEEFVTGEMLELIIKIWQEWENKGTSYHSESENSEEESEDEFDEEESGEEE